MTMKNWQSKYLLKAFIKLTVEYMFIYPGVRVSHVTAENYKVE